MIRLLLWWVIALLQISPGITGQTNRVFERPRLADEAEMDSIAPVTGAPLPVFVEALDGVPAAAAERGAFLQGFRGRFRDRELPAERLDRRSGTWRPDRTMAAGLRLADAPEEKGTWTVRVQLDWYVPHDGLADSLARAWPGRGARVTVTAVAPETPATTHSPARTAPPLAPRAEWLRFPAGHPVDAPYYQLAGRQVACLVIEAVQRARGELGEDRRARLEQTERSVPVTGR